MSLPLLVGRPLVAVSYQLSVSAISVGARGRNTRWGTAGDADGRTTADPLTNIECRTGNAECRSRCQSTSSLLVQYLSIVIPCAVCFPSSPRHFRRISSNVQSNAGPTRSRSSYGWLRRAEAAPVGNHTLIRSAATRRFPRHPRCLSRPEALTRRRRQRSGERPFHLDMELTEVIGDAIKVIMSR